MTGNIKSAPYGTKLKFLNPIGIIKLKRRSRPAVSDIPVNISITCLRSSPLDCPIRLKSTKIPAIKKLSVTIPAKIIPWLFSGLITSSTGIRPLICLKTKGIRRRMELKNASGRSAYLCQTGNCFCAYGKTYANWKNAYACQIERKIWNRRAKRASLGSVNLYKK